MLLSWTVLMIIALILVVQLWRLSHFYQAEGCMFGRGHSLVSVIKRSSWHDPLPEWGWMEISNENFHHISLTEQAGKISQSDFPCLFCGWDLLEISLGNYTSASFWQRIAPTAPFKDWYIYSDPKCDCLSHPFQIFETDKLTDLQ